MGETPKPLPESHVSGAKLLDSLSLDTASNNLCFQGEAILTQSSYQALKEAIEKIPKWKKVAVGVGAVITVLGTLIAGVNGLLSMNDRHCFLEGVTSINAPCMKAKKFSKNGTEPTSKGSAK